MDTYFNLGRHRRPITTTSPEAQLWFDWGLNWSYAFHCEEALRCFEKAIELGPDCAMGYWGIAYATSLRAAITMGGWVRIRWRLKATGCFTGSAEMILSG